VKYVKLGDVVAFPFAVNNTNGNGDDFDTNSSFVQCRLQVDSPTNAPVSSASPFLLSHANYPAGCGEVFFTVTTVNGFAANKAYSVYANAQVTSANPTGLIGEFTTVPVFSDIIRINSSTIAAENLRQQSEAVLKGNVDAGSYSPSNTEFEVELANSLTVTTSSSLADKTVYMSRGASRQFESAGILRNTWVNSRMRLVTEAFTGTPNSGDNLFII